MSKANIALVGYNYVGRDVAEHLSRRPQKFVIADSNEENLRQAEQDGYKSFPLDLTNDQTLEELGIGKHIEVLFCLLDQDSENVFLTISARAIDPALNIISICRSDDANRKLLSAGANKIINPYQISGRKIYEIIRKPEIVELLDNVVFGQTDLNMVEITIESGSQLDQHYLEEFDFSGQFNMVLLGVEDKELGHDIYFATSGINHKLDAGDKLIVIGPAQEIERFKVEFASA